MKKGAVKRGISHWNAFLPIGNAMKSDELGLDPTWAAAMGVDKDALTVLRCVRRDVLPLVRDLQCRRILRAFSVLIHDRSSGVPCPPEDSAAYIHLRLEIDLQKIRSRTSRVNVVRALLPVRWTYVSEVNPTDDELRVQRGLYRQSEWYLELVEGAADLSDIDLLRHVGQTLHFFANMAQMIVR